MSIFFSTHCYALGWQLGIEEAAAEFRRQCEDPDDESLPCVRTLARLRHIDACGAWCDSGSTRLGHSRSRAFHDALESDCDVWVTCDDDCEADLQTLRSMFEAVQDGPRVCIVPFLARTGENAVAQIPLNLSFPTAIRTLSNGAKVARAITAGLGLTALSRSAMQLIAAANDHLGYTDAEGVTRRALFIEAIRQADNAWMGEDMAFFSRVPSSVSIEALMTGRTIHAGRLLDLELLGQFLSQKTKQNQAPEESQK